MLIMYVQSYRKNVGERNSNLVYYRPHLIVFLKFDFSKHFIWYVSWLKKWDTIVFRCSQLFSYVFYMCVKVHKTKS